MAVFGINPGEIKRFPITAIKIYKTVGSLVIFHPEAESSYRIVAKTRTNDTGSQVTLGYTIESTFYIPYNDYKSSGLISSLNALSAEELGVVAVKVYTGTAYPSEVTNPPKVINSEGGMQFMLSSDMVRINFEIESIELRPRLLIKVNGFVRDLTRIYSTIL